MSETIIRPLRQADRQQWEVLWDAYLAFYESAVEAHVKDTTFARFLTDGEYEPSAMVAERDGKLVGLVHYMAHRHCWRVENVCYLQDLYADESVRGQGVGRKLIEAVYAVADEKGYGNVYWNTQHFNDTARKLYDRIASVTPFIKYQR